MAFAWYRLQMVRRPILMSSISTAILFGSGDLIAQQGIERRGRRNHDFGRTLRTVSYGGLIFGPIVTRWYGLLARIKLPPLLPSLAHTSSPSSARAVIANVLPSTLVRVLLDQIIFAPAHISAFMCSMAFFEHVMAGHSTPDHADTVQQAQKREEGGEDRQQERRERGKINWSDAIEAAKARWREGFLPGYKANLALWPAVQMVNFAFVPLHWRVMSVNCVALGWNCYLSVLNSKSGSSTSIETTTSETATAEQMIGDKAWKGERDRDWAPTHGIEST